MTARQYPVLPFCQLFGFEAHHEWQELPPSHEIFL